MAENRVVRVQSCEGCRHWSELVAKVEHGMVVAMCLHPDKKSAYTYRGCGRYEAGEPDDLVSMMEAQGL